MVVSLKGLQDSSRGTKLVSVKWHHRWCIKLTRSSLTVVSTSHAVNGCSPRVPLVSHSQTTFSFILGQDIKEKKVVWLYARLGSHKVLTNSRITKHWPHTHTQTDKYSYTPGHWKIHSSWAVHKFVDVICLCGYSVSSSVSSKFAQSPHDK